MSKPKLAKNPVNGTGVITVACAPGSLSSSPRRFR